MIAITREKGRVVVRVHGQLDDEAVGALLGALAESDDDPIVIDLADASEQRSTRELGLLAAIAFRSGAVAFRHAHGQHRRLVRAGRLSA